MTAVGRAMGVMVLLSAAGKSDEFHLCTGHTGRGVFEYLTHR